MAQLNLQPSMPAQGISGGWNYYQPDQAYFPPVPQHRYADWPQQANVFQFPAVPAPAPATAPAPVPVPVPVRARYATVDVSDFCSPMEHEEREVVAPEPIEDECPTFEAVGQ
ncbi:hypothetical protein E4U09_006884 [Claviceps aff. purpurea]|uniref:Uncharacterized protein n=1 Tax=Claviceps aff. purpurea TaxID=1967640 RepID=A0A9P7U3R0_9HYPO|nr:hypothetical protein E4U09_006884 [Claviceps aff. purpurea]